MHCGQAMQGRLVCIAPFANQHLCMQIRVYMHEARPVTFARSTWAVPGPKCIVGYVHTYGNPTPAVRLGGLSHQPTHVYAD